MEIKILDLDSKYAEELNLLLNEEWPETGAFENEKYGISVPNPIGVVESGSILGGLSFTSYKAPSSQEIVIWVNAVLVQASYRHQGLGSRLITAAQSSSPILYALTDIPTLYTKLGWQIVKQDSNGTVVHFAKIT